MIYPVIEIMTYRLRDDVDAEAFSVLDEEVQTSLYYQQRGLVRRTTARSTDDTVVSITVWSNVEAANAAHALFLGPTGATFRGAIAESSIDVRRYENL